MSVYLTGDVHCPIDVEKLNTKCFPVQKQMTKEDYLIVLGDFGLLWHENREFYWWKRWFDEKNFTTLWIDGNHENFEWIDRLPVSEWHGGKVHKVSDSIIHLMRGQVFEICNKYFWTFGGAASHDKAFRREGVTWWAREEASYAEQMEGLQNLYAVKDGIVSKVDYILTHTCPDSIVEEMFGVKLYPSSTGKYLDIVKEFVNGVINPDDPSVLPMSLRGWYFGHWHVEKTLYKDNIRFSSLYNSILKLC